MIEMIEIDKINIHNTVHTIVFIDLGLPES
jgi:hypothetical protein